jgi:hypothetical protein
MEVPHGPVPHRPVHRPAISARDPQAFNGTGLALHFLVGNVLVLHTGLKEMWFGWRVKKIFPEKASFEHYCRDAVKKLDLVQVSRSQKVRFWLYGSYADTSIKLHFFDGETPEADHPPADLAITLDDGLIGFRSQLIQWLDSLGRPMPADQVKAALWPEAISREGLDAVGRALEIFYVYSAYGGDGPLAVSPFKKAAAAAPESLWRRISSAGRFTATGTIRPHGAHFSLP